MTKPMTDPKAIASILEEGERLAAAATLPIHKRKGGICGSQTYKLSSQFTDAGGMSEADAAYIVHACNHFPALAAEVRRLREALDGVYETIKHGDAEHQAWLKAKCDELKDGR